MAFVIVGIVLLLALILVAVKVSAQRVQPSDQPPDPKINASGVYSVVRRNVRESVMGAKPTENEIRQYLGGQNEDTGGNVLSDDDKEYLVQTFVADCETNIEEVEAADNEQVDFFYYDYLWSDPVCEGLVSKGNFVTRDDIHAHPRLVPPFHLGCGCRMRRQHVTDNLRKTLVLSMRPLLTDEKTVPKLPNWHAIHRLKRD